MIHPKCQSRGPKYLVLWFNMNCLCVSLSLSPSVFGGLWETALLWGGTASYGWPSSSCTCPLHHGKYMIHFCQICIFMVVVKCYIRWPDELQLFDNEWSFWVHMKTCFISDESWERSSLSHVQSPIWCVTLMKCKSLSFPWDLPQPPLLLWTAYAKNGISYHTVKSQRPLISLPVNGADTCQRWFKCHPHLSSYCSPSSVIIHCLQLKQC